MPCRSLGGSPGPHPEGGSIWACTEADTPQQMATAAGGTLPTGMHSSFFGIYDGI